MAKKKPLKKKLKNLKKRNQKNFLSAVNKTKGKLGNLVSDKAKPRIDPLWTLDDGITYSDLSKFDVCRQRFHIGRIQGWKPKGFSLPLEFGNIFHLLSEAQDRDIPLDAMEYIAKQYTSDRIEHSIRNGDDDKVKELKMLSAVVTVTFLNYVDFWKNNPTMDYRNKHRYEKSFKWIGKEIPFDEKYQLPNGRVVRIRGKMDGAFSIPGVKGNWLFETKTKSTIDQDGIFRALDKDLQTGLYMVAMSKRFKGTPLGVVYNVVRRTAMRPRVKDTPDSFAQRVHEDIQKRPEWYFFRWTREISALELENFQRRSLNPAIYQLCQYWDSIKDDPMNPFSTTCPECYGDGCLVCGQTGKVDNMLHYERPFGIYDSFQHSQKGSYFDIVADGDYSNYEQEDFTFPELAVEDELKQYLDGLSL
jgi:hypothetical protein